ncbi:uncharacterized protein LOC126816774 [Patella vulgata]|uniref:uncharacterized protein LOC126816774 n=1 Tax=Patella vulgata TaxID=6465 RepID=UPI0024A7D326|nr:uncharacterized protein LOC126816774 [Patella vulgata]
MLSQLIVLCVAMNAIHARSVITEARLPEYCLSDNQITARDTNINCLVPSDAILNYDVLKLWSDRLNQDFSFTIECENGGTVELPWPMKAQRIVNLKVNGCRMVGFFKNMKLPSNIPDTMKDLIITNSTIVYTMGDLIEVLKRYSDASLSEENECGQQTMTKFIFRDIKFDAQMDIVDPNILMAMEGHVENMINSSSSQICDYRHLAYFDESGSTPTSSYHFKLLTMNTQYPSLRTYRTAEVDLWRIPDQLQNYRQYFPCLKRLDMSNNNIETVNFTMVSTTPCLLSPTQQPSYINLRFNKITTVSAAMLDTMMDNDIIVDVRNNPINCTLQGDSLKNYAEHMVTVYPTFSSLFSDLPCREQQIF